jgi:CDP-paratose 2-epimerase
LLKVWSNTLLEKYLSKITEPFCISGTGKQVRDMLYADDMKSLYIAAITNTDNVKGHAFNL